MKRPLAVVCVLVTATLFATPMHATLDEIRILRGSLHQAADITGTLSVQGTGGVSIDAALSSAFASIQWDSACSLVGCLPGEEVTLGAGYGSLFFLPLFGSGQVSMQGQTYSLWTDAEASAVFQFDGAIVLPPQTESNTAELSAPFTFSGSLQIPNRSEPGTHEVLELRGSGVATVLLSRHLFNEDRWVVSAVIYDFDPRNTVIDESS